MNGTNRRPVAVVTGASSGIGAAAAVRLAAEGFEVVVGARRLDRLQALAERCGAIPFELDVTDPDSVEAFTDTLERVDVLVNNAGLALGREPIEELSDDDVETMWQTNVMGLLRVTRGVMPMLLQASTGHIVNVGSIAGVETYPGGGGYTATKHAVHALTRTLRIELVGRPVRVTEVLPGLVQTEFSIVRFREDADKAAKPYEGLTPLTAEDIADCIGWAVTRPPHVNIDEIVVRPIAQATATTIARSEGP